MAKNTEFGTLRYADIVKSVAAKAGISQTKAREILDLGFHEIRDGLYAAKNVEIPRFAKFELVRVPARKARNPLTGEAITTAPKVVAKVRVRKDLFEVRHHVK